SPVLRRDLRRDEDLLLAPANDLPDDLLAVPVAVGQRGIDEVEPEVDRPVEGARRFLVAGADPLLCADPPGAVSDLGNLEPRPSQRPVVHRDSPRVPPGRPILAFSFRGPRLCVE